MSKRRVYSARVQDKHGALHGGNWFFVKTASNGTGQYSTRKAAEDVLERAKRNNKNLIGHVATYLVEKNEPLVIMRHLAGNVVPINKVDAAHRDAYREMLTALAEAGREYGSKIHVNSSYRTRAEQEKLYAEYLAGGNLAAEPGTSMHELGLAIDVPNVRDNKKLMKILRKHGFRDDVPSEKWHLTFHGA